MDYKHHFQKLFKYDNWGNQQTLASLKNVSQPPQKAVRIFAHILAAEKLWHYRLTGQDSSQVVIWPEFTLEECEAQIDEVHQNWIDYLESLIEPRFSEAVAYRNSQGTPFETSREDILTHVTNHGGYHRGQIATILRNVDAVPAVTDYIAYVRQL